MGVITGSVTTAESQVELAYSEDSDVVAGAEREGCGWCPVHEFERVGPDADVVTVRTLNEREFTRGRDLLAIGEATRNVFVVKSAVVSVRPGGKRKPVSNKKAVEWLTNVAVSVPAAIDLLAQRQIHVSQLKDPHELYPGFRLDLGYPAKPSMDEPDEEEVAVADGAPKSEG